MLKSSSSMHSDKQCNTNNIFICIGGARSDVLGLSHQRVCGRKSLSGVRAEAPGDWWLGGTAL